MVRVLISILLLFMCFVSWSQTPNRFDVVIDEIMADPNPQIGLPNNEWIELRNTTNTAINLQGWRVGDATGQSGPMPAFILQPDSFVIVCTGSAVAAMSVFGRVISVTSFPSLDNDADRIYLQSVQGKIIHAVEYNILWYGNPVKADGGWTLEMMDTKNPCSGMSNWKGSIDALGGTPGKKNSVDGINADATPPQLIRTYSLDSVTVVAVFDEPLDSTVAGVVSNYTFSNSISIISATPQAPLFNTIILKLSIPIQRRTTYVLSVSNIKDCKNNLIGVYNKANAGLAEEALSMDMVINEILFNPKPTGEDYVELYNRSNKIIDATKLLIANRNSSGVISSFKNISATPFYIFPGDHIVITENTASLKTEYFVPNPQAILSISSMPSFPDDKGIVVITNSQGAVVDEVAYTEKWHFALINNSEGVALERIDPAGASNNGANWHSAASTVGYGTPGYKNSQYLQTQNTSATIEVAPKVFSPDNDGFDDIATISYQVERSGYVANVTIFDAGGRPVRYLVKNELMALKGGWNWDGLGEKLQKLPVGTYIIFTELFTLDGKKQQYKNPVVLARRLN